MGSSRLGRHARGVWHVMSALLLLLSIAGSPLTRAQNAVSPPAPKMPGAAQASMAALPLAFEPNRGQVDVAFSFLAHAGSGAIGFMPGGLMISQNIAAPDSGDPLSRAGRPVSATLALLGLRWQGSNPQPTMQAGEQLPGVVNYLRGSDPAHWQRDVPTYATLTYENLYPGIALHYGGDGHAIKGTYTVAPGA